jgi:hypothetical protein
VIANEDAPEIVTSDDQKVDLPPAGETTKIVYVISGDTVGDSYYYDYYNYYVNIQTVNMVLPDGSTIPLSNLNDNTAVNPYGGQANYYYVDRSNRQIVIYLTPETADADYTFNVYYKDANTLDTEAHDTATLNKKQLVVRTQDTTYNYYKKSGGCDAGVAAGFAAVSLAAAALIRRKRGS